jgi:hypothetical protein
MNSRLSGTLQGAGGIGGLLAFSQLSTTNSQHFFYHADGNGNITCLTDTNQFVVAKYLYDRVQSPQLSPNFVQFLVRLVFHPADDRWRYPRVMAHLQMLAHPPQRYRGPPPQPP